MQPAQAHQQRDSP